MEIVIIGAGRVGRPLAEACKAAGHRVRLLSRADTAAGEHHQLDSADLAFLTVPDQVVAALAGQVTAAPRSGLVHCSGQLVNRKIGSGAAMFHPLMSFRGDETAAIFRGCPIGINAPDNMQTILRDLAQELGARPFILDQEHTSSYHLAAMFASVFPYILLLQAKELAQRSGLAPEEAGTMFGPIFRRAADHLEAADPQAGLTGPVSRGDAQAVRQHLEALAGDHDLAELYRALTRISLRYAGLDAGARESMEAALQEVFPPGG